MPSLSSACLTGRGCGECSGHAIQRPDTPPFWEFSVRCPCECHKEQRARERRDRLDPIKNAQAALRLFQARLDQRRKWAKACSETPFMVILFYRLMVAYLGEWIKIFEASAARHKRLNIGGVVVTNQVQQPGGDQLNMQAHWLRNLPIDN